VALARGVLDLPNARSSHGTSTPRGGGIAIVLVTTVAVLILALARFFEVDFFIAIAVGGLAVAMIGFADDHRPLPSSVRLMVHLGAAIWEFAWLGGLPPLRLGSQLAHLGWVGNVLAALGIVWVLNLFNFMDGIDGIAASEAVYVVLGGAWLTASGDAGGVMTVALVVAAACGDFCCGTGRRRRSFW